MRPVLGLATGGILCLSVLVAAGQDRRPGGLVFQSGVELIQLDVSVLDASRRPVRGLMPEDFTVVVDGEPRPVVAFKAVDLAPPPPPPSALWMREIAPDVVSNIQLPGRVVAVVIDDASFGVPRVADLFAVRKAREVARAAVDQLGPDDVAAVLFTENGHSAQSFTHDRRLLAEAIDNAALVPSPSIDTRDDIIRLPNDVNDPFGVNRPSCDCGTCSIEVVGRVADALRSLPQQRKIVIFISAGVRVDPQVQVPYNAQGQSYVFRVEHCNVRKQRAMADVFRRAGLANVTVQAVDVRGLLAADRGPTLGELGVADTAGGIDLRVEFLRTMAAETGGRAVVRNNDMEREVPALVAESSAYYLLGVEAGTMPDDGRLHAIQVRVNRPDAEVRTRRGFYAPTRAERQAMLAGTSGGLDAAIAGALPSADIPLDIVVTPVADPTNQRGAALAIVVGVTSRHDGPRAAEPETVHILTTAFNPETGASAGSERHTLSIGWNGTGRDSERYEVLSRLPVAPGRYEIRAAVEAGDGRTGSVFTYAEVPDFRDADLSVSGLMLTAAPAARRAPPDTFRDLLSEVPTARRTFGTGDRVEAMLRIYERGDGGGDTTVTTRLTDAGDEILAEMTEPVLGRSGRQPSVADHHVELPIEDLLPGEYLLSVEVSTGRRTARRDVRFRVE